MISYKNSSISLPRANQLQFFQLILLVFISKSLNNILLLLRLDVSVSGSICCIPILGSEDLTVFPYPVVCWSWLIATSKDSLCTSLSKFVSNDITLVTRNQPCGSINHGNQWALQIRAPPSLAPELPYQHTSTPNSHLPTQFYSNFG